MFVPCRRKRRLKLRRYASVPLNSGLLKSALSHPEVRKVLHVMCLPPSSPHCPAQSDDALTHSPTPFIFLSFSNLSKGEEEDVEEEEQVVMGMSADQETDRHFCHHHILL